MISSILVNYSWAINAEQTTIKMDQIKKKTKFQRDIYS